MPWVWRTNYTHPPCVTCIVPPALYYFMMLSHCSFILLGSEPQALSVLLIETSSILFSYLQANAKLATSAENGTGPHFGGRD